MAMTASEFKRSVGHSRRATGELTVRPKLFLSCDCGTCVLCLAQENSTHYHFHTNTYTFARAGIYTYTCACVCVCVCVCAFGE